MKVWLGAAASAALALLSTAATAQPYSYYGGSYYYAPTYSYGRTYDDGPRYPHGYWRDSDRDGVPDRAEWNRDRDHDGRPDQWDRYDDRRGAWRHRYDDHRDGYAPYSDYGYGWRY
jgi:hypothetical protein